MWQTELSGQVGSIKIEWRSENGLSRSLSPAQLFRTDSEVTRIEYNLKSLQENWVYVMSLGNFSLDFRFPGINSNDWLFSANAAMDKSAIRYSILLESSQLSQFWPKMWICCRNFRCSHKHNAKMTNTTQIIWEKTFTRAFKNELFR